MDYAQRTQSDPPGEQVMFVCEKLDTVKEIFKKRNAIYGDSYKDFGHVMEALFPNGIHIEGAAEFQRFIGVCNVVGKLVRFTKRYANGHNHQDSLDDMIAYTAMLSELMQGVEE